MRRGHKELPHHEFKREPVRIPKDEFSWWHAVFLVILLIFLYNLMG
jgi:hypothetical protein